MLQAGHIDFIWLRIRPPRLRRRSPSPRRQPSRWACSLRDRRQALSEGHDSVSRRREDHCQERAETFMSLAQACHGSGVEGIAINLFGPALKQMPDKCGTDATSHAYRHRHQGIPNPLP